MVVFFGADHGGFRLKERLRNYLKRIGVRTVDCGAFASERADDFPIYARRVALAVRRQPGSRGILVCRSGVGMDMAANKCRGIRAVAALLPAIARRSRREEDANVLSLAADFLTESAARAIIRVWLKTSFRPALRYRRRLRQLARLDARV